MNERAESIPNRVFGRAIVVKNGDEGLGGFGAESLGAWLSYGLDYIAIGGRRQVVGLVVFYIEMPYLPPLSSRIVLSEDVSQLLSERSVDLSECVGLASVRTAPRTPKFP